MDPQGHSRVCCLIGPETVNVELREYSRTDHQANGENQHKGGKVVAQVRECVYLMSST